MNAPSKPWGIVLEWDEDGLTCQEWLSFAGKRLQFAHGVDAQWYIDNVLTGPMPQDRDVIVTVRQFT